MHGFVSLSSMEQRYDRSWVETQVGRSIQLWNRCALGATPASPRYSPREQRMREKAYDEGLRGVQREARKVPRNPVQRQLVRQRIVSLFPRFAGAALGLDGEANQLLTHGFLPVGTQLARWARSFDSSLSMDDTIQACRNAWTCCGLQALLGQPMKLTPSILAYSLLYPYSDNYLDDPALSNPHKLDFSERFRQRLCGRQLDARNSHEAAIWTLVRMIEDEYPRSLYPQVFDGLLAIHRAQEQSIAQLNNGSRFDNSFDNSELLRITCAKGGTSVLADACLAQPWLTQEECEFSFDWGVLLQLGDDLQDLHEDLQRGSVTLFTRAVGKGEPLDNLVRQLLHFSAQIAGRMDRLPNGTSSLKDLLRMSWRSLILMAVADAPSFFSPAFLAELEPCSSFSFKFLRARNQKLSGRQALYATLFDAFLEAGPDDPTDLPLPIRLFPAESAHAFVQRHALSGSFA